MRFDVGRDASSIVFLCSNVTREIPDGAGILGSESYYGYVQEEKVDYLIYQDGSHMLLPVVVESLIRYGNERWI